MKMEFFKNKKNFIKGNSQIKPDFYWYLVLGFGVFLIASSIVFGIFLFRKINKDLSFSFTNSDKKIEVVEKERIDGVLKYFSVRESKSLEIINSQSPIVDPSL